jgi:hypothetical protein
MILRHVPSNPKEPYLGEQGSCTQSANLLVRYLPRDDTVTQ